MSAAGAGEAQTLAMIVQSNLPILQIVLPMMTAPLCVLARRSRIAWALATGATLLTVLISWTLLQQVIAHGFLSYYVGGWTPPYGIELRIEPINAFVLVIVSSIVAIVLAASRQSLHAEVPRDRHYLIYAAVLLCMTGLLGMASAGDAFNVFVFLEISSLSSYAMIAMGRHRRALTSAYRYLIMGTTGGTLILLGIGMLYSATGTLNIEDLGGRLQAVQDSRTVVVALAVIVIGASIKLALLPFGAWLPNAYTFAPSVVTAFLAATATKVAYYVLLRFIFRIFGADYVFERFHLDYILMPLAIGAMFLGAGLAIFEKDVKRLLAFSSLSQIGYMVLGLSLVSVSGLTGGIVHMFNHALIKSGLFLVIACVVLRTGSSRLEAFQGLGRRMPLTMAAFVAGGLALIGVPLTAGFVSKWYLVTGAVESGLWPVAMLILLSSLLAVVYVWKVVEVAYFREPLPQTSGEVVEIREAPLSLLIPSWLLIGGSLYFGIFTEQTVGVAQMAARALIEGTP